MSLKNILAFIDEAQDARKKAIAFLNSTLNRFAPALYPAETQGVDDESR